MPAHRLHYGSKPTNFTVVPDATYAGMWRIRFADGSLSDMANLSRARDAACAIAERGPPARNRMLFSWKAYVEEAPTASYGDSGAEVVAI